VEDWYKELLGKRGSWGFVEFVERIGYCFWIILMRLVAGGFGGGGSEGKGSLFVSIF